MKDKKITAKDRILQYMKDFGSITTWEAFSELGITRLSEYIRQLRLEYRIEDEWVKKENRYGEKVEFKKYFIVEENK